MILVLLLKLHSVDVGIVFGCDALEAVPSALLLFDKAPNCMADDTARRMIRQPTGKW